MKLIFRWVLVKGNVARTQGQIAVSRSFGDFNLKKFIISEPDVTEYKLKREDLFIVMGTDGLWNVSSDLGISIV